MPYVACCRWVLDRLKNVKEFEGNKQYVSELLSILMQSSTANQLKLAAMNGIDALLSCVFPYKGRNARTDGEEEYVGNLFGCLCSCLMPAENKLKFMQVQHTALNSTEHQQTQVLYVVLNFVIPNPPAVQAVLRGSNHTDLCHLTALPLIWASHPAWLTRLPSCLSDSSQPPVCSAGRPSQD